MKKTIELLIKKKAIIRKINLFSKTNIHVNVFHKYITTQNIYYPKIKEVYKIIILIEKQTNINKGKNPAFLPYTSSCDCLEQFPVRM